MTSRPLVRFGLIALAWAVYGLLSTGQAYVHMTRRGIPDPFHAIALPALLNLSLWAALTPAMLHFAERLPLFRRRPWRNLLLHIGLAVLISLFDAAFMCLAEPLFGARPRAFLDRYLGHFDLNFFCYFAIVGIGQGFAYYRELRARELRTAQLEAQLLKAQLHALRAQIQPHFLFNTLHAISEIVHESPAAADRMITRLGDLLRLTLEGDGAAEVPLARELEVLGAYLEIERVRFRDRLSVRLDVDPRLLGAQVPHFVLQPLVENAIRHGLGGRRGPGAISVSAARVDRHLRLEVRDDGDGPRPGAREGVGLGNTRARLRQLYGEDGRLDLQGGAAGGAVATVLIPLAPHRVEAP
jgi:two-component system, LytTR family, sensor kinase